MGRIVVIGLDAFHDAVLQFTPHINSLFDDNPSGTLASTTPPVTAPAWASFQTGKNQGKHGLYDFVEFDESMAASIIDGRSLRSRTVYEQLDAAGHDCFLYNLPFSNPARIDGDVVPSWLDSDTQPPTPEDLYERYDIERPRYPSFDGGTRENVGTMRESVEHNCEQFFRVLSADDHDFYFQLVSETDWLQHEAYFDLFERPDADIGSAAKDVLAAVDDHVARITDELGEDDRLLLLSDHGFTGYDRQLYVNDWLAEEGYLTFGNTNIGSKNDSDTSINVGRVGRFLFRQEWLHPLLRPLRRAVEGVSSADISIEQGIDFSESVAVCHSNDERAIRLADWLDDDERRQLRDEIIAKLNAEPGIEATAGDELYEGPYAEEAGEIIYSATGSVVWRGSSGVVWRESRKANHDPHGVIAAIGFDGSDEATDLSASLVDVTPTILAAADCAIPTDIDGEPIADVLATEPDFTEPAPYDVDTVDDERGPNTDAEQRLRDLGYL